MTDDTPRDPLAARAIAVVQDKRLTDFERVNILLRMIEADATRPSGDEHCEACNGWVSHRSNDGTGEYACPGVFRPSGESTPDDPDECAICGDYTVKGVEVHAACAADARTVLRGLR